MRHPTIVSAAPTLDPRAAGRALVREIAQALIDLERHDAQLAIWSRCASDDDILQGEADLASLELRVDEVEKAARRREGHLRFALGDLLVERVVTGEGAAGLDAAIAEREQRLARIEADLEQAMARAGAALRGAPDAGAAGRWLRQLHRPTVWSTPA